MEERRKRVEIQSCDDDGSDESLINGAEAPSNGALKARYIPSSQSTIACRAWRIASVNFTGI